MKLQTIQQGLRSVQEYLAEFCGSAALVQDWPKAVKVQFFQVGLDAHLVQRAGIQDDLQTLLAWIQLACEVENCEELVDLI